MRWSFLVQRQSRSLDGRWVPQSGPVSPATCLENELGLLSSIKAGFISLVCPHLVRPRLQRALLEDLRLRRCGDEEAATALDVAGKVPVGEVNKFDISLIYL